MSKRKKSITIGILSIMVTVLMVFAVSNEFPTRMDYNFKVVFSGDKNVASLYNEVWLKRLVIDGKQVQASLYGVPQGWESYAGFLHAYGDAGNKQSMDIELTNVGEVGMIFALSDAEGIVNVIGSNGEEQRIDLYSQTTIDEQEFTVTVGGTPHVTEMMQLITFIMITLLLVSICLIVTYMKLKFFIIWQMFLSISLLFISKIMLYETIDIMFIMLFSLLSGVIAPTAFASGVMPNFHKKPSIIGIGFISLYSAFALVGHPVILKPYGVEITWSTLSYLLLLSILIAPMIYSALYVLTRLNDKVTSGKKAHIFQKRGKWWILFVVMCTVYSLFLIVLFPGNIPSDAMNIWNIIHGNAPYWMGHPYYYYQIIHICSLIIDHPAFAVFMQYAFFAAVCASFLIYLCEKGLPWCFAVVFSVMFSMLPSNGIGQVTLLKDYPVATVILFLTYIFIKLLWEKEKFYKFFNLFSLGAALLLVALLRHNTFLVFYACLILFFVLSFSVIKNKRRMATVFCLCIVASYFVLDMPVKKAYADTVKHMRVGSSIVWMVSDQLAGVAASGEKLSPWAEAWMETFMPLEQWASSYTPYNLSASPSEEIGHNFINKNTILSVMPVFFDSVKNAPVVTIKTRLNKMNILWDITPVQGHQVYAHINVVPNDYALAPNENVARSFIIDLFRPASIWQGLLIRTSYNIGFYLIVLLILFLYFGKGHLQILRFVFVPVVVNVLSLAISCSWQDFRYYYAVIPVAFFLVLFSVCAERREFKESA